MTGTVHRGAATGLAAPRQLSGGTGFAVPCWMNGGRPWCSGWTTTVVAKRSGYRVFRMNDSRQTDDLIGCNAMHRLKCERRSIAFPNGFGSSTLQIFRSANDCPSVTAVESMCNALPGSAPASHGRPRRHLCATARTPEDALSARRDGDVECTPRSPATPPGASDGHWKTPEHTITADSRFGTLKEASRSSAWPQRSVWLSLWLPLPR